MACNNNNKCDNSFKAELEKKADAVSETYAWEQHQEVARDAAIAAASKSADFAKVAEAGFPAPQDQPEGYVEMAQAKLAELSEVAKEQLGNAGQVLSGAMGSVQQMGQSAVSTTSGTISGAVEVVREKAGEALEFVAEKMQGAGEALADKSAETKERGLQMQKQAELNNARNNLQPVTGI